MARDQWRSRDVPGTDVTGKPAQPEAEAELGLGRGQVTHRDMTGLDGEHGRDNSVSM
jgi:hypothetical protein